MQVGRPIHRTTTGVIQEAGAGGICQGIRLVSGSDAATATIRQNGSGGQTLFLMKAASELVDESRIPFVFEGELHVTLTGTDPTVTGFV